MANRECTRAPVREYGIFDDHRAKIIIRDQPSSLPTPNAETRTPNTKLLFGCGYLGRRVAAAWHAAGDDVHVVTRSPVRAAEFEANGWTAHVADICEPASLAALPAVHTVLFAVGYDRQSNRTQREVMVDGVANVLTHYRERCERFVYISSTSVYRQQHGEWVDETSPTEPTQPGGQYCLAAEQLVWQSLRPPCNETILLRPPCQGGVREGIEPPSTSNLICPPPNPPSNEVGQKNGSANVLRLAGIYGPHRLLARSESLQRGEPIAGNPDAWLNLIHVDDAVAAIRACEQNWRPDETYLVCDDQPIPRRDYFTALAQLVQASPPVFDESIASRRGSGGFNKRCRNWKLRELLGLTFRYPTFQQGLPASISD